MLTQEERRRFLSHVLNGRDADLTTKVAMSIVASHLWQRKSVRGRIRAAQAALRELAYLQAYPNPRELPEFMRPKAK